MTTKNIYHEPTRTNRKMSCLWLSIFFFSFTLLSCENPLMKQLFSFHTVSFNSNGGSKVASQQVMKDETVKRPANPKKEGYSFIGWSEYNYDDDYTLWNFNVAPNRDLVLYAIWNIRCEDGSHTFTEWEETTPATCTEAAVDTEKCAVCGILGINTEAGHHALGHYAEGASSGATEATCTEDGYTGTGTCIRCSMPLSGEVIDKWGHEYHDWTAPTCTTPGNSERYCTNDCGTRETRTDYAALGHTFTEWEETSSVTCTEAAVDTEKCAVCGILGTNTEAGHHALGHYAEGASSGATEATCTEDGYTGTGTCIRCSTPLLGEVIDKWGHEYHDWTTPTCTTVGNSQRNCNNDCGTIETRTTGYAVLGHTGIIAPFAASCTTAGNSALSGQCVRFEQCGHVVTGTVVNALGHTGIIPAFAATCTTAGNSVSSGNCVRFAQCGQVVTGMVENALTHLFSNWTIRTHETCTATGLDERFCTRTHNGSICNEPGYMETQTRAVLGHNYRWTVTNITYPATSTEVCTRCSIPATPATRTTQIGDTGPAGGIIFYIADGQDGRPNGITIQASPSGTPANRVWAQYTARYLEAAPANETASQWGAQGTLIDGITTVTSTSDSNALLMGNGRRDTQTIVNSPAFAALQDTAAQRCASKNLGGYTDWFLPSLGELIELSKARTHLGITTIGWYWSSSQYNVSYAWDQGIGSGGEAYNSKNASNDVRAIRAF